MRSVWVDKVKKDRARARCSECGFMCAVSRDGLAGRHKSFKTPSTQWGWCAGVGKPGSTRE